MLELALVLLALAAAGIAGPLIQAPAAGLIAAAGIATLMIGLAIAVPTGLWYHIALYRLVSARAAVPRTWWLAPSSLHTHLTEGEQRQLARWYRAGGAGFMLCLAGGLSAIASLLAR